MHVLHLLAAVTWVGGTILIAIGVLPILRKHFTREQFAPVLHDFGMRFRVVAWICILTLIVTGLHKIRILFTDQGYGLRWDIAWDRTLIIKLTMVGVVFVLALIHDFILGPAVGKEADAARRQKLVVWTRALAISQLILMVAIVATAAILRHS